MFNKAFFYSSVTVLVLLCLLFVQGRNANEQFFLETDYSQEPLIKETVSEQVLQRESSNEPIQYKVSLLEEYLCGTIEEEIKDISAHSVDLVRKQFHEYVLQKAEGNHLWMKRVHHTIHPQMLGNIYFGLNGKNELVIAHKDQTTDNPLKVFFPLEMQAMELSLPKQQITSLQEGILVKDNADYYNILSTFSEYIIEFPYDIDWR